ncbi:M61 family metallopeptidase [Caulobacter sp. RL271]|uniref:Peptidase M61 catalytic domain-containing protein n=1 Tax=Caulobacter segnis TaxID=88688 RepID=A0ABY4ZRE5_9CAUL|nr:hypothetical protein [Caulobacter segnis]USQ95255.1 hypothetical protein MZV50_22330 [Caulobacter segnis]
MTALVAAGCLALPRIGATAPNQTPVDYSLAPVLDADGRFTALSVTITFRASTTGATQFELPSGYGGGSGEGWRNVRDLRIDGATSIDAPDPGHRVIHAKSGARLTAAYTVVPGFNHDPLIDEARLYRPIIRPGWFHVGGASLFARPYADADENNTPARFDWLGQTDLTFASDLETIDGKEHQGTRQGTLHDVQTSIVIGGKDVQIARSGPVRFAIVGAFSFRPQQATELAERILSSQRAFWGDPSAPFLVTMSPLVAPSAFSKTVQGNGRSAGFTTQVTPNTTLEDLAVLFAHENFHTWNPGQLGGQGPQGSLGLWFSEGFTDFYARRLLLRSGVISPQRFVDLWNDALIGYAMSPVRNMPNAQSAERFWKDPYAQRLPYQRGALLAALWDARLRAQSHDKIMLDDLIRAQREAAAESPEVPAFRLFPQVAAKFGLDVSNDLARYLDEGQSIDLPYDAIGSCFRLVQREQAVYDRGWDQQATSAAGGVITGLREDSPAWRAGVRNGMRVLARSFDHSNDSTVDFTIRVSSADGSERDFHFKPEGKDRLTTQRMELRPVDGDCASH